MNDKRKKRHCMVVHAYYPDPRVRREAEALVDSGYEVDVICLHQPGQPNFVQVYDVNVYRLPVSRHKGKGFVAQLLEYFAFFSLAFLRVTTLHLRHRYDVVQVHNPPDFLIFATIIVSLTGAKTILDLHDLMPEFYASRFDRDIESLAVRLAVWQEQLSCRFADRVITVTELWRQRLIQRGVPPDKCSVVMNVADNKFFRPDRIKTRPSRNGRFHLFYHGNVTQRYGLDLLLQALARLKQDLPNIYLTINGRGDYVDELRRLSEELGLEDDVSITAEYIPIETLLARIATADLGIVPYRSDVFTDEILPTKLMEYAALGIPAVAARTRAISAYFDDTMVEFFPPDDEKALAHRIKDLYENQARLNELANNIQKFNHGYDWTSQKCSYLDLVAELAEH